MNLPTTDLYPLVRDLTEAEYGSCSSDTIFGSFSLKELAVPTTTPRPLPSPDRATQEKYHRSNNFLAPSRKNSFSRKNLPQLISPSNSYDNKDDESERERMEERELEFEDSFVLTRQVFRCKVSTVWECVHRESGIRKCVKVIDRRRFTSPHDENATANEISMLSLLKQYSSDNIVQATQITKDLHRSYIVMNYIEGGNLASALSQHGSIAEEDVQSFARSLIESIGELHSLGIGHFNLQPENILLRRGYQVSLCDLGNAAFLEDKISGRRHGNLAYAAPEDILKKPCASSDMWSIGVILFYCFCGHLPFDDSSNKGLKQKIFGHKYDFSAREWAYVSRGAKQFLSSLLHPDPHIRVTATEALNHPWLSSTEQRLPAKRQRRVRLWERLKRRQQKVPYDPRASTLSYSNNPFETFAA